MNNAQAFDGIAIIGMAGRFPNAENITQFWHNLCAGVSSIQFLSGQELIDQGYDLGLLHEKIFVPATSSVSDVEWFDADFFGYAPREASAMDPQQRLLLECAWEALEDAGYNPLQTPDATGIFTSCAISTYMDGGSLFANLTEGFYPNFIGNAQDYASSRISYKFNLRGPSITLQTMCSSSLVAVHLACQSLLNGESDMALAGGVSIRLTDHPGYFYREGGIVSPDGHCRAFDAEAQGTVFGSGLGLVVLKPVAEAIEDGDHIYAVIRGSAINNDGADRMGFAAPSISGQAQVIAEALAMAEVEPDQISYIETHGTGTLVGDPIEISALTNVFRAQTDHRQFCAIGSVKTNIGHLEMAAGIANLIKATLALQHRSIPASLNFQIPNPELNLASSPFYVNTELCEWQTDALPRRAGVSSFGMGGTNAHAILEEAPEPTVEYREETRSFHLFVLSAKTATALHELAQRYRTYLDHNTDLSLTNLCYTISIGRAHFEHRLAIVFESVAQLQQQLELFVDGKSSPHLWAGVCNQAAIYQAEIPSHQPTNWFKTYGELAMLYVQGATFDWPMLYPEYCQRISLPTYAFQRQRYWINRVDYKPSEEMFGPLIHRMIHSPIHQATIFETEFSTKRLPFLADHRIYGEIVSPGACHLAIVLSAASLAFDSTRCQLEDILFPEALLVHEMNPRTAQFILTSESGGDQQAEFQLISFLPSQESLDETATHAMGRVTMQVDPHAVTVPINTVRQRCTESLSVENLYTTATQQEVTFGPCFQWIANLWQEENEVLARLVCPTEVDTLSDYLLHPGLLQSCFQVAGLANIDAQSREQTLVPFSIGTLSFYGPMMGSEWWCHTRRVAERRWDIQLFDGTGRVLVDIIGFEMRATPRITMEASTAPKRRRSSNKRDTWQLIRAQLQQASNSEKEALIVGHLQTQIATTLGIGEAEIDIGESFIMIGLDSLMSIELRHQVQQSLSVVVPIEKFFDDTSIEMLAKFIATQLSENLDGQNSTTDMSPSTGFPQNNGKQTENILADLLEQSDTDATIEMGWIEVAL